MGDLATLANLHEYLGIPTTVTTWDGVLGSLITRVSAKFEVLCARTIASAVYTDYYNGNGGTTLQLKQYPVSSITSIKSDISWTWDSSSLIASTDYTFDSTTGIVYAKYFAFLEGVKNIQVVYTAGYSTTPTDIVDAICEWVASEFNRRKSAGVASESFGGISQTYAHGRAGGEALPAGVQEALDFYTLKACSQ